jgi:molybdopterin molybdotransferase
MTAQDRVLLRSVDDAQRELLRHFAPLGSETVPLMQAIGRVLQANVYADINVPPFANSSMDGYAVRSADLEAATGASPTTLRIIGEVPAGGMTKVLVEPGTTIRIMTGAPVPPGADAVVPFEDTDEKRPDSLLAQGLVRVFKSVDTGAYIRSAGGDIQAGRLAVPQGTWVDAATIGVLATVGAAHVEVYRRPKVAILATGDELVEVHEQPGPGQIRNANGYGNAAQVLEAGGEPWQLPIARDTETEVIDRIQQALDWGADLFLTSGGVSVGDYDVVKKVLTEQGQLQFWRVNMKPGKPVAFGHIRSVPLLGLPGNPVSAMVSFELFGLPALLKMGGRGGWRRPVINAQFTDTLHDRADRQHYVRVQVEQRNGQWFAHSTGDQGSSILTSMLHADGLMIVPPGMSVVEPGTALPVMMLRWPPMRPNAQEDHRATAEG